MDINEIFSGCWNITRTLDGTPFFVGEACFTNLNRSDCILYREEGGVTHPSGFSGVAFKEYYFSSNGNSFTVHFDEERLRLFNHVHLIHHNGSLTGSDIHLCNQDRYESEYTLTNANRWTWAHSVTGPRKRYQLHSLYERS